MEQENNTVTEITKRRKVEVDAVALWDVLHCLIGEPHLIRELMVIEKYLPTGEGSISMLIQQYNEDIRKHINGFDPDKYIQCKEAYGNLYWVFPSK